MVIKGNVSVAVWLSTGEPVNNAFLGVVVSDCVSRRRRKRFLRRVYGSGSERRRSIEGNIRQ